LWNVTFVCLLVLGFLAHISVVYSRGWIVLFYLARFAGLIVLRFAVVRLTALARSAGLISAQRILLIGTGAHVGAFVHRYEPRTLGASIIGCRLSDHGAVVERAHGAKLDDPERLLVEAVASSDRDRMIANPSAASPSTRAGTTSSRASPAGRRSTGYAAPPTPTRKCASVSSTTCSTSTIGRCGST
jgi:hypothetical protein